MSIPSRRAFLKLRPAILLLLGFLVFIIFIQTVSDSKIKLAFTIKYQQLLSVIPSTASSLVNKNPTNTIFPPTTNTTKTAKKTDDALQNIPRRVIQAIRDRSQPVSFKPNRPNDPEHEKYEHMVFTNAEQSAWVKTHYPLIHPHFTKFKYDIHRYDFFRFLAVYHYGGFYFDSDVYVVRDLEKWYTYAQTNGSDINMLVGIEADTPAKDLAKKPTWRPKQLTSWTFAAVARHPVLERLLELILSKRVTRYLGDENRTDTSRYTDEVGEFASPAVLTDAVASYLLFEKGVELSDLVNRGGNVMVGDLYVASVKAFACGNTWSIGGVDCSLPSLDIKVRHTFAGSWQKKI